MSQLLFTRTGPPLEVLELHAQERPMPGPGEVLVRMLAAAINPADFNFIEGTYGTRPNFPCIPGMEGVGVIEELGPGVDFPALGSTVLPLDSPGAWSQWRLLTPDRLHVLPTRMDPHQAALLRVNPPTAWGLLHATGTLPAGAWVAQNAASSAAGHCVIQIAKALGLKTINFVRRADSVAPCQALGADLVFTDDADGLAAAKAALEEVGGSAPSLALNAVGGDSALRLLDLLGQGGTHITYGAMSRQALKVPNGMLIFKGLTLTGFWMTHWKTNLGLQAVAAVQSRIVELVEEGKLEQKIAATYPVSDYRAALAHAAQNARDGKILLTF